MSYQFLKSKLLYIIPLVTFIIFTLWWIIIQQLDINTARDTRQLWGAIYQIMALYGGIIGLFISNKWGGYKSLIGKAILAFSIGLFLQCFGQSFSSYYVYFFKVESPAYPSIGDIGFFGSVIAYIYGVVLISTACGLNEPLKIKKNKIIAIMIPVVILIGSYLFFLKEYEFDWSNPIKIFLDFGYPFGQAIYVSIAVLTLLLSRNILGGIMKKPIFCLIFALIFQYLSDFFFLYQANLGVWYVGNINDYLYFVSYSIITMAIIYMGNTFTKIQQS